MFREQGKVPRTFPWRNADSLEVLMNPPSKSDHTKVKAFIFTALSEAILIALAETKAAVRKTATATSPAASRLPLPWYEITDSISPEISK